MPEAAAAAVAAAAAASSSSSLCSPPATFVSLSSAVNDLSVPPPLNFLPLPPLLASTADSKKNSKTIANATVDAAMSKAASGYPCSHALGRQGERSVS